MEFAKSFKKGFLLVSLCFLVLGVVLLVYPTLSMHLVCYALGGIVMIYGVLHLILYFSCTDFGDVYRLDFVTGVLMLCAGVYVIAQPYVVAQLLPVLLGIVILVDSLIKLQNALDLRRLGVRLWWTVLLACAVTAALGIVLVIDPFTAAKALTQFIGAALIVDACVNFWSFSFLAVKLNKLRHAVAQEMQAMDAIEAEGHVAGEAEILRPEDEGPQRL